MIVTLALIAVASCSLYGWGRAVRRIFQLERGPWPATAGLGLALLLFLGGLLNLARLARPSALAILAGLGILLAIPALKKISLKFSFRDAAVLLVAVLIVGFTIRTQLPPYAYNFHDDYQKYFAHPVRMLETGTLYASPLSSLGSQSLGGQAFLQGFIVAFFPITYINGFDAIFALFLCLMLASEFAGTRFSLLPTTFVCMLTAVIINPQYVNVSSLYSGAAIVMTLALICCEPSPNSAIPSAAAAGLLYAALIALKPTFALFVSFHLIMFGIMLGLRWGVRSTLFLAGFLSPWVLLHAPHYLAALHESLAASTPPGATSHVNIFSFEPLAYGSSIASYTLLMLTIGLGAALALWSSNSKPARLLAVTCAAGIATYLLMVWGGPLQSGYGQAVRYFAPFAIGLAPAAFGLAAFHLEGTHRLRSRIAKLAIPLAIATAAMLLFLPSFRDRVHQAMNSGSVLAFSWLAGKPEYLAYNREVLYGPVRKKVESLQELIPPHEPVIAWINTPFYLDYARNPIHDPEPGGLTTAWAAIPAAHYLIWEYDGYATRPEEDLIDGMSADGALDRLTAASTLEFLHRVTDVTAQGQVLFDDGHYKVVRLRGPS